MTRRSLENRSLDRGLTILNALSIHGPSTLQDLHLRCTLPKSTIRRLLATLMQRKVVRRGIIDRRYHANIGLPMQTRLGPTQSEAWLVDCAVPHMIELTRSIGWSCDLHIFERTRSRIIESTRSLSPFFSYARQLDLEVPVFGAAAGLAVLSTWTDAAVLALVDEIGDDPVWGLRHLGLTKQTLLANLREMRSLGYAVRAIHYRPGNPQANGLHAIARPVCRDRTAVGALVVLWPKEFLAPEAFAEIHLARLVAAASAITADLTRTAAAQEAIGTQSAADSTHKRLPERVRRSTHLIGPA